MISKPQVPAVTDLTFLTDLTDKNIPPVHWFEALSKAACSSGESGESLLIDLFSQPDVSEATDEFRGQIWSALMGVIGPFIGERYRAAKSAIQTELNGLQYLFNLQIKADENLSALTDDEQQILNDALGKYCCEDAFGLLRSLHSAIEKMVCAQAALDALFKKHVQRDSSRESAS